MAYDNIPGVKATYLDGAFRTPTGSTQPKVLVLGAAKSGLTYELFNVTNVRQAETEFGADTEVMKGVHEVIAQGADNCAIMRAGGTQGSFVLTDNLGGTLTIIPESRDNEIMDRYALILEVNSSVQRIVVFDLVDEQYVYDSDEILVLDEGAVEVTSVDFDLFETSTAGIVLSDTTTFKSFTDTVLADYTPDPSATAATATPVATQGTDGLTASLCARYAALNQAYHLLDYRDADFVFPQSAHIDDANVVDTGDADLFWKGVPVSGSATDQLGFLWQYIYRGKLYTYFTDTDDYFTVTGVAATLTMTTNVDIRLDALKVGTGGNKVTINIIDSAAGGLSTTITEPAADEILITVDLGGAAPTMAAVVTDIDSTLGATTLSTGVLASTLISVTDLAGAPGAAAVEGPLPLAGGLGGHALTHAQLTGDTVPADVTTRWGTASDSELRECNFAHQLATFCERASTTWKTMLGAINTLGPPALSRLAVADWVGTAAVYSTGPDGQQEIIDSGGDNGTGLLGIKLTAGQQDPLGGYRNAAIVDAASSAHGLAYGGLIKTVGASLPNADDFPDHSYGINSADEATDVNSRPYDIGKHIFICYDYPILRNAYNGGTTYRGEVAGTFIGKVVTMPENEEPIGLNGRVVKVTSPPRIHATQLDQLAKTRLIGLRREEGTGFIFTTAKTAAHPDSDYTRLSTIRSVNRELQGIRNIAKPFIGKDFSAQRLVALQSAIDVFLQAERAAGFNQGARASLSFTRTDKIMGRLTIKLRMVPPFSIEHITVETSLAADESEL